MACSPLPGRTATNWRRPWPWRSLASDDFVFAVVAVAMAMQGRRPEAGVELVDPGIDGLAMLREQRVALQGALDDEGAERLPPKEPQRLRNAQVVQPVHGANLPDAPAKQCAGAIADGGQVDGAAGRQHLAVVLGGHAALADQDAALGLFEPLGHPFGKTETGRCRDRADLVAPMPVGRCG